MAELNLQYENIGKKMPKVSSVFIETLKNHKVDRFFCVPGESYLPIMNELVSNPYNSEFMKLATLPKKIPIGATKATISK